MLDLDELEHGLKLAYGLFDNVECNIETMKELIRLARIGQEVERTARILRFSRK